MKDIALPSHIFMHSTDDTAVDLDTAVIHAGEARRNGAKVILAGLYIERELEHVIGLFLYPSPPITEQQSFVAAHILGSDSLTFAAKRRLVLTLVNEKGLLEGSEKATFDKQLKEVMVYRNAFTHGDVIEKGGSTYLKYFQGGPQERELTDEYFDGVVATFKSAEKQIEAIKRALMTPT